MSAYQVCLEFCAVKNTAGAAAAAAAVILKFGLSAIGFGSLGVSAGSVAAWLQSTLFAGSVPAGGWFATMTSWGMTAAGAALGLGAAGAAVFIYAVGVACGCPF